jgi:hypothetical protein
MENAEHAESRVIPMSEEFSRPNGQLRPETLTGVFVEAGRS